MPRAVQGEVAAARAGVQERGNRRSTGFSAAFPLAAHTGKLLLPYRWSQTCLGHTFKPAQRHRPNASCQLCPTAPAIPPQFPAGARSSAPRSTSCTSTAACLLPSRVTATRTKPAGHRAGEKPAEGREMPRPPTHPHSPSRALLLTPMKSHTPVHWERQPRRRARRSLRGQTAGAAAQGTTHLNPPRQASSAAQQGLKA